MLSADLRGDTSNTLNCPAINDPRVLQHTVYNTLRNFPYESKLKSPHTKLFIQKLHDALFYHWRQFGEFLLMPLENIRIQQHPAGFEVGFAANLQSLMNKSIFYTADVTLILSSISNFYILPAMPPKLVCADPWLQHQVNVEYIVKQLEPSLIACCSELLNQPLPSKPNIIAALRPFKESYLRDLASSRTQRLCLPNLPSAKRVEQIFAQLGYEILKKGLRVSQ